MSDFTTIKGKPINDWTIIDEFHGFQTKFDATKIQEGAAANGQNTTANDGDRISVRELGYEVFPSTVAISATASPITSVHTFRKRDGVNVMMRAYGTVMEYFSPVTLTWETLHTGYTSGLKFGFADYNINTDLHSYVYFGNAVDNFSYWSGDYCKLTAPIGLGDTTINVDDTSGFEATGSIIINGNTIAYSALTGTTFTVSATSFTAANGSAVAAIVTEDGAAPKGNIYLVGNNRLFIAGIIATPASIYFSEYGNAKNFVDADLVTSSTATSPGIFNLGEGGGAVVGLTMDEKAIYGIKRSIIYSFTLSDSLYTLQPLKPFDGKSQTIGGVNANSCFAGGNGVFFITPDNQISVLSRVENVDYPQRTSISDVIKPTVDNLYFDKSAGIVFKDKAYIACRSTGDLTYNDTVLVFNIDKQIWDTPVTGWNVADFTIYNDGTNEELYFADAVSPNIYKINTTPIDGEYDVKASWKSKQYNFDAPHLLKQMTDLFIEGYISPSTTLTINLYLDEDGYTNKFTTTIVGTETGYVYDTTVQNPFGLSKFGIQRFGSNEDVSGKKKFRIYLGKDFRIAPFHNAQIEFISDGSNQQWEVITYGFLVGIFTQPTKLSLYKSFK